MVHQIMLIVIIILGIAKAYKLPYGTNAIKYSNLYTTENMKKRDESLNSEVCNLEVD